MCVNYKVVNNPKKGSKISEIVKFRHFDLPTNISNCEPWNFFVMSIWRNFRTKILAEYYNYISVLLLFPIISIIKIKGGHFFLGKMKLLFLAYSKRNFVTFKLVFIEPIIFIFYWDMGVQIWGPTPPNFEFHEKQKILMPNCR